MRLKLALDWTPNTNHIGFFVAQEKGFYQELGLEVVFSDPSEDQYQLTPAKKVELGKADLALCPFESVISYQTKKKAFDAIAIATVFQEDLSAIVVRADSNIKSPKDLDGTRYASYQARYEDHMVRQMIRGDGGLGELSIAYPEKLGIWQTIENKTFDATWVFMNWEGLQANAKSLELRSFKMAEYGVPYAYSPIIMASKSRVDKYTNVYRHFLTATKKGFLFARQFPKESAAILWPHIAENDHDIDLVASVNLTTRALESENSWGIMDKKRVQLFLAWLKRQGLEQEDLHYERLVMQF